MEKMVMFLDRFTSCNALAINPRDGAMLRHLMDNNSSVDSFVSDDEWVNAAKVFSNKVYHGYSHHPLRCVEDAIYDLIIICEDMGFVDDCDAMYRSYYRLLKPGGALVGGLWNISYADSIDSLLAGESVNHDGILCGNSSIPLDCLTARLRELGFQSVEIHKLPGERTDIERYTNASNRNFVPAAQDTFNTRIHFICAYK